MEHELAQELAKITLAIQDARREFQTLQEEKEQWLQERESENTERIKKALETSRATLEQTNEYAKEVEKLRQQTEAVVAELKEARTTMHGTRRDFAKQTQEVRAMIDNKTLELATFTASVGEEKMRLNGLLDHIKLERAQLRQEQEKINDDRAKLATAIKICQKPHETIIK